MIISDYWSEPLASVTKERRRSYKRSSSKNSERNNNNKCKSKPKGGQWNCLGRY